MFLTEVPNLWPDQFGVEKDSIYTPLDILKFQADLLAQKTKNIVSAEFIKNKGEDALVVENVTYTFFLVTPQNKKLKLFETKHNTHKHYPMSVVTNDGKEEECLNSYELTEKVKELLCNPKLRKAINTMVLDNR